MFTNTIAADVHEDFEVYLHPADRQPLHGSLTEDERRELDQWHADRNYVESGDDHAFDLWLNGELARLERRITALEMQLEAANTF